MTMTASGAATRRIGLGNGLLWIVASIVIVVVASTTAYGYVVAPYTPGGGFFADDGYPWEAAEPLEAEEIRPGVWSADASAVIRIPAAEFDGPVAASIVAGADLTLYRTDPADLEAFPGERPWPDYLAYVYGDDEEIIVPDGRDLELWVRAGGPWQLSLAAIPDVQIFDDIIDGKGDAVLMYRGDAVSARFTHVGEGPFYVNYYTDEGWGDTWIIESGPVDARLAWDVDTWVVFTIESDADRGAWTVDIEGIAPSTPSPTPTPTETPR